MSTQSIPSKLGPVFARCRDEGRSALIGYLPVGFPTVDESLTSFRTMVDAGCDIIEVGVPYSDPVMDGPTIQDAADQALTNGVRVRDVFTAVEAITSAGGNAVVMSYWNPVLKYGVENFARDLAAAGGAGLITPNLIPEEGAEWHEAADRHGLDRIYLVAPSSTTERIALTVDASRGFVYAASTMGVTGARDAVSDMAPELCARVREYSDIPIGVGLGVRNREQAAQIASYADGVIVGSALVTAANAGQDRLASLVCELAEGVRSRRASV
ncbi:MULTISPECIES: tryptophan synthase subunit alpha [unclassified Gordonia (in: high G+C Gram-positive bacteria)]|uniref:tryptophan synthase subunit alpha n=1 Tax=unclassified Gordonia (in: high G+C Gram-positive bacteria) TaxID=2657482 RepID=UPI00071E04A1|nr:MULTISPECIES: tryptophan synthase subunit alpha [unclassified Gordonia (in: high G+C Gram-positive bacteria)]KSU58166.1 tryptophan synthase subunit alpha [Gordonia sp. SGD-V-85]MCX2753557.1 tryptophan synthase subunit alpha [Gordonia sp. 4N]SCC26266.1 tryptophan synthase, alpha chain [Gordonia sp. v-85]